MLNWIGDFEDDDEVMLILYAAHKIFEWLLEEDNRKLLDCEQQEEAEGLLKNLNQYAICFEKICDIIDYNYDVIFSSPEEFTYFFTFACEVGDDDSEEVTAMFEVILENLNAIKENPLSEYILDNFLKDELETTISEYTKGENQEENKSEERKEREKIIEERKREIRERQIEQERMIRDENERERKIRDERMEKVAVYDSLNSLTDYDILLKVTPFVKDLGGKISVGILDRKYRLGCDRAEQILDMLITNGVVDKETLNVIV